MAPVKHTRTQEERSERTRKKLIDTTIDIIISEGISHVRIQKITKQAGVSSGALQHHFKSKDELLYAALDQIFFAIVVPANIRSNLQSLRERCAFAIDAYWKIYSQRQYRAALEIILQSRAEPTLRRMTNASQRETIVLGLKLFDQLFEEYGVPTQTLEDLLLYTLSHLRGLAVQRLFNMDHDQITRQLQFAEDTLYNVVQSASVADSGSRGA